MWPLTGFVTREEISFGVGILGMPGSTAYGGLIGVLRPNQGKVHISVHLFPSISLLISSILELIRFISFIHLFRFIPLPISTYLPSDHEQEKRSSCRVRRGQWAPSSV